MAERKIGIGLGLQGAGEVASALGGVDDAIDRIGKSAKAAGQQASEGLGKVGEESKKVADQAMRAGDVTKNGWSEVGKAVRSAVPELENLAARAYKVNDALGQMEKASASPAKIQGSALSAQRALDELRQMIERATAAGVKFGPEVGSSLDQMQGRIQAGVARMGEMKAATDAAGAAIQRMVDPAVAGRLGKISDELLKSAGNSRALQEAARGVEAALQKLATADGPKAATRAIAEAREATDKYRQALDQAKASGQNISGNAPQALGALERQLKTSTNALGQQRDALKDTKVNADLAADAHKVFGSKIDSVLPALASFAEKGRAIQGVMGAVTSAAVPVGLAIAGVAAAMKATDVASKALGNAYVELVDAISKAGAEHTKEAAALAAVAAGHVPLQKSMAATVEMFDIMAAKATDAERSLKAFADAAKILTPEPYDKIKKSAVDMEVVLAAAFKKGGAEFLRYSLVAQEQIKKIADAQKLHGDKSLEYTQKAIDTSKKWNEQQAKEVEMADRLKNAGELKLASLQRQYDSEKKLTDALADVARAYQSGAISETEAAARIAQIAQNAGLTSKELGFYASKIKENEDAAKTAAATQGELAEGIGKVLAAVEKSPAALTAMTNAITAAALAEEKLAFSSREAAHATDGFSDAMGTMGSGTAKVQDTIQPFGQSLAVVGQDVGAAASIIELTWTRAGDAMIQKALEMSDALQKLAERNEEMADRMANSVAFITQAWESGAESLSAITRQIQMQREQMERLIALNAGEKIAADMQLTIDALDELEKRINSGGAPQPPKVRI